MTDPSESERGYHQEYKDDLAQGHIYPDGTQREPGEPDCGACYDSGVVRVDVNGNRAWPHDMVGVRDVNCPDCRPTPEQLAEQIAAAETQRAEWERAVAAGEIVPDESPF